jgi:N-acetylglucosaminylphosphatidylinositol deacetylase
MEINILSPSLFQLDSKFLLVIAHPDDEVLFFSPFIIACKNHNNPIAILCISDGNYYGQGPKRRKEIIESAVALGLEPSDVTVLQDLNLLDGHQNYWSPQLLSYYINEKIEQFKPTSIITFDEYGVSGKIKSK